MTDVNAGVLELMDDKKVELQIKILDQSQRWIRTADENGYFKLQTVSDNSKVLTLEVQNSQPEPGRILNIQTDANLDSKHKDIAKKDRDLSNISTIHFERAKPMLKMLSV